MPAAITQPQTPNPTSSLIEALLLSSKLRACAQINSSAGIFKAIRLPCHHISESMFPDL
jgi:hypothetical protein